MNNKRVIIIDKNGKLHKPRIIFNQKGYTYIDRNINVTNLPIKVNTNCEYEKKLFMELDKYLNALQKPPFIYELDLIETVKKNCESIKIIFASLKNEKQIEAEILLKEMLKDVTENSLFYSELDKSYAFRAIAPFENLHSSGYEAEYKKMMETDLTFFRLRTKKPENTCSISSLNDIVHLPYNKRDKASNMRFSSVGIPCLYLGVTSLVCAQECRLKSDDGNEIYCSVFVPNDEGKKLKILALTFSQYLIDGIQHNNNFDDSQETATRKKLQSDMLKLYPLLLAVSFTVAENDRKIKYEYLISQCLMKIMHNVGIDGIAYLSAQGENEFQYPQCVNLAIPAYDISDTKQFSKYCSMFEISKPVKFERQCSTNCKSYINTVYEKYLDGSEFESFTSKVNFNGEYVYYGDTDFGKFDNYLCSLKREIFIS